MSASEPMTRRERVARAISEALPPWMLAAGVLDPTGKEPPWWPDGERTQALTSAAIEALRPDEKAFSVALDALIQKAEFLGSVRDTSTREDTEPVYAARREVERLAGILADENPSNHAGKVVK